jgi:predicted Zn-dependent peptidase
MRCVNIKQSLEKKGQKSSSTFILSTSGGANVIMHHNTKRHLFLGVPRKKMHSNSNMTAESLYIINNGINVFHVAVYVNAGAVTEPEKKLGISHMLEHMLFQTPKTKELVHSITRSGAVINGATDIDTTMYYVKTDASAYKQALHLISSIVFDSYFTSNDLDKERRVVIEELHGSAGDTEGSVIWEVSNLTLLSPDHLYMRKTIGTIESLRALTVADLKKYYKEHYSNAIIVVNCPRNLVKPVEEFFKSRMTKPHAPVILPQIEKEVERKVIIFNKDQEQSLYVFTFAFFPDKPSLKLRLIMDLLRIHSAFCCRVYETNDSV